MLLQAIKYNEEHSHGSLVALAIAIFAIFATVNFNKVILYNNKVLCITILHLHRFMDLPVVTSQEVTDSSSVTYCQHCCTIEKQKCCHSVGW